MFNLLSIYQRLLNPVAPVGHASERAEHIRALASGLFDESFFDNAGNFYLHKKGDSEPVLFFASLGTRALQVIHIDENGFIKFIGEPVQPLFTLGGKRVRFASGTIGAIAVRSDTHLWEVPALSELSAACCYIDVGAKNAQEASSLVNIGDYGVMESQPHVLNESYISGTYLSDLAGSVTMLQLLSMCTNSSQDVFFLFAESPSLPVSVNKIAPKLVVSISSTAGSITPKEEAAKLSAGPAIDSHCSTGAILNQVFKISNSINIPVQFDFSRPFASTENNIDAERLSLSIPVRYHGTLSEIIDCQDIISCASLLAYLIK